MNNNARPVPPNAPWHGQWDPNKKTPNITDEIFESLSDDEKHLVTRIKANTTKNFNNRQHQNELTIHLLTIFEYYKSIPRANLSMAIKTALDAKFPNKEDENAIKENYGHELAVANIAKNNFRVMQKQLKGQADLIGDLSKQD